MASIPAEDCKRLMLAAGINRSTPKARRVLMESILRNICGTLRFAAIFASSKPRNQFLLTDDLASIAWGYLHRPPAFKLYGKGARTSLRPHRQRGRAKETR